MDIIYLGSSSFKIRGRTATVIAEGAGFKVLAGKEAEKVIDGPGEYEIGGISAIGLKSGEKNLFVFEVDGLRILYLGLGGSTLSDEKVSQIGAIDILIIEAGTKPKDAATVVGAIDPYFVLPFSGAESIDTFLAESGLTVEKAEKFSLKKEEMIEDQTAKVILLPKK